MKTLLTISFIITLCFIKGQDFSAINSGNILQYLKVSPLVMTINNDDSISVVLQEGNHNNVDLFLINDSIIAHQKGNDNQVYYKDSGNMPASMIINMIGDNNLVEVIGSNSISDGMKIDIIGSQKTIQIENH